MQPDRYEVSTEGPHRLSGVIRQRGVQRGTPAWGGFVFGALFVAAGLGIVLVGTKVLPVKASSVHAPFWVLTVAGAAFIAGGLMAWTQAWRQVAAARSRREAQRRHPDEPALADYPWQPEGFGVSE